MILAVCSTKGGVSKSTLASNLTVALAQRGHDVLAVDGDEQRSLMDFTAVREQAEGSAGYTAVELHGANLRSQVQKLAGKYTDVIIDVGGRDTGTMRAALVAADTVLIPVPPSSFDLWSLEQTIGLVTEARALNPSLRALVVLSIADPSGKDNDDAAALVKDYQEVELLPSMVVRRKVFRNAATAGKSVLEYQPRDLKAEAEITALLDNIMAISGGYRGSI